MLPRRLLTSSLPPMLLATLVAVVVLVGFGVPLGDVLMYAAYLAFAVAFPGVFAWRALLRGLRGSEDRPIGWFEDLSLGTIFGFGLQLPFFLLGVALGAPLLVLVLPLATLAVSATRFGRRVWSMPGSRLHPGVSWVLAGVFVYGLVWLGHNTFPMRPLSRPPFRTPSVDETFHQSLAADIGNRFPPEIPFLLDTRLDYHWFVHAQMATSEAVTGLDVVVALRLVLPVVLLGLIVCGLGAVALRLTGRPVAAAIAPALLTAGAFHLLGPDHEVVTFTEPFLTRRFVSSPSQTYGVMMSLPALMLLFEAFRPHRHTPRGVWVALSIALVALAGSKATFLPIFVCGAIAVWAVLLLSRRRVDVAATSVVVLLAGATVLASVVIFGGRTGALDVEPLRTVEKALLEQQIPRGPRTYVAMTGALLAGWLVYGAGALGLLAKRRWLDPRAVFMLVSVAAGVAVALTFHRSGLSQLWFQRSVAELVALLSAWGLACLLPRPLTTRDALRWSGVAAVAGIATYVVSSLVGAATPGSRATYDALLVTAAAPVVVVAAYVLVRVTGLRTGARWTPGVLVLLATLLGLGAGNVVQLTVEQVTGEPPADSPRTELFAKGGVAAAVHVRDNSPVDAVVATNMHCREPNARLCDNRHFWVSAYTERRVVIEGWGYSALTNEAATGETLNAFVPVPLPERIDVNDTAFVDPSAESVGRLVEAYGVDWLLVGKDYPADVPGLTALTDVVDLAFENRRYAVFEVR